MNERIRLLAEQAGDDWDSTLQEDKAFLERFAQLIVGECCEWIESSPSLLTKSFIVANLKGRFGVEE